MASSATHSGGKFCVAWGPNFHKCQSTQFTPRISMHCFPVDERRRGQWTEFVRKYRPDFVPSSKSFLCSAHFLSSAFSRQLLDVNVSLGGRRILSKSAVPVIYRQPENEIRHDIYCTDPIPLIQDCETVQAQSAVPVVSDEDDSQNCEPQSHTQFSKFEVPETCFKLKKKITALQKKVSWYKKTKCDLQERLYEHTVESSGSDSDDEDSDDSDSEITEEEEDIYVTSQDEDDEDEEWQEINSDIDEEESDDVPGDNKNTVNIEPDTVPEAEPKFVVFYSMLMQIFSMFCFHCKRDNPKVHVRRNGSMAIVTQVCSSCRKQFQWRSQPFVFGKYPAGNLMMSFGILISGIGISQALLLFRHMGLLAISARTYFYHQRLFLFPAILRHWQIYQATLLKKLEGVKESVWSGDGRFDSPGHNAKYGVYTMFSNSISKLVHFELMQSNQAGSSNAMELEGAKRCFDFLKKSGVPVSVFISDRHLGITKWIRESKQGVLHFFDLWHVTKGITKKLAKAAKEKGCEILSTWSRGIRNHLYWAATSTNQGFGELIAAKWTSLTRHAANLHTNHPNTLFQRCCHGNIQPRKWIEIGTLAYDKLVSLVTCNRTLNDVKRLSNDPQTSCLEGFHSTLNHWHPKMTHYSWLGTYCRHVLAILHFNENLRRERRTSRTGHIYYNVKYPKYRLGEEVVKEVAVPPTYEYAEDIRRAVFHTDRQALTDVLDQYSSQIPETLTSQFVDRATKQEAVSSQLQRKSLSTQLFPDGRIL